MMLDDAIYLAFGVNLEKMKKRFKHFFGQEDTHKRLRDETF